MRRLHSRARDLLVARLGARSPALPFAEAVVAQVAHPLGARAAGGEGGEERLARRVADLLLACEGPEAGGAASAARLAADPSLLASFFQNVDLLYAASYPYADAVGALTLAALHHADEAESP